MENISCFLLGLIEKDIRRLATVDNINVINNLIRLLPESDRIALEISLNSDNNLDIHYNIRLHNKRIFNTFLNDISTLNFSSHPNWKKVINFLTLWNEESSNLSKVLDAIFLEFDTSLQSSIHPPAIFFKIKKGQKSTDTNLFIKESLTLLNGKNYAKQVYESYETIKSKLHSRASVNYIGLMLSRDTPILRINITHLQVKQVFSFLKSVQWDGNWDEVTFFIKKIAPLVDSFILSIDVFENRVLEKIGFEFKITNLQEKEVRFHKVLYYLKEKDLITDDKANYLIKCNKNWNPHKTKWHPSLVYNSLYHDLDAIESISYFLSHLKMVITKGSSSVKAYMGLCQDFTKSIKPNSNRRENTKNAIKEGIDWLLEENNQSGYWTDYLAFGSKSDQWITGVVGSILILIDENLKNHTIIKNAQEELIKCDTHGYNQCTVADSDSSSWVIYFLKLSNHPKWKTLYKNLISTYYQKNKGFITYKKIAVSNQYDSWKEVHPCVTASANLIKNDFKDDFKHQLFQSKWWVSQFYTGALFSLKNRFNKEDEANVNSFINQYYIKLETNSEINTFDLSLLLIFGKNIKNDKKKLLLEYLKEKQLVNGGWEGSAKMKLNDDKETIITDQNGILTTAFIILALKLNTNDCTSS